MRYGDEEYNTLQEEYTKILNQTNNMKDCRCKGRDHTCAQAVDKNALRSRAHELAKKLNSAKMFRW